MDLKQIPRWKYWLSYLMELHIESTSSDYNPHLYVSLKRGRYQLSTANAVYSYGDLYDNFAETFNRYRWDRHNPQEVLLLGLGLGSIPLLLEQVHNRICHFTAIEIDDAVTDLAYRYVLADLEAPINMITADASIAVQQLPSEQYDLICVDIFDDDKVPPVFESTTFLRACQQLLAPKGVLLFNRLAHTPEDRTASITFFREIFELIFPDGQLLEVADNYMLVNRSGVL